MSKLNILKEANKLEDLAKLLGYSPASLAYILYKIPDSAKYHTFEVPKKNSEKRVIHAPIDELKKLQQHLSNLLHSCIEEIENKKIEEKGDFNAQDAQRIKLKRTLSHGFTRDRSIHSNALVHKNKRYVLNFDLEDFFPSINFGRIMGFFINNRDYQLNKNIAVIIAQIACHEKALPQGSPCSPIISNLIAHILDIRLVQIARKYKCTYSRYADDITFSTNKKEFPSKIAFYDGPSLQLHKTVISEVKRCGFVINPSKTRLNFRDTRQTVTGLVVNNKVNVRSEYYRQARAMAHNFFHDREYHVASELSPVDIFDEPQSETDENGHHRLEGILQHIHHTRDLSDHRDRRDKQDKPTGTWRLFSKFLYFRHFGIIKKPLIICEGVSDSVYIKLALKKLAKDYPSLISQKDGKTVLGVSFLNYSKNVKDVLRLSGGTGELAIFVGEFKNRVAQYKAWSFENPIILLTDNDDGAKKVFGAVKGNSESAPDINDESDFYHVNNNLYLVKTPKVGSKKDTAIEDMFDPMQGWEKKELGSKKFTRSNKFDLNDYYGKRDFAEKVIAKNFADVNFEGFRPLLDRLVKVIDEMAK